MRSRLVLPILSHRLSVHPVRKYSVKREKRHASRAARFHTHFERDLETTSGERLIAVTVGFEPIPPGLSRLCEGMLACVCAEVDLSRVFTGL